MAGCARSTATSWRSPSRPASRKCWRASSTPPDPDTPAPGPLWRIVLEAPEHAVALMEAAVAPFADSVSILAGDGGPARLEATTGRRPHTGRLETAVALAAAGAGIPEPAVVVARLAARDWVREAESRLPPVRAGRFLVHGSHVAPPARAGRLVLRLDAGLAFGTGHHETTRACLLALDALERGRRFTRALDLGCGSGILALAAARLFRAPVLAADIDPQAVRVTAANARANGLAPLVRAVRADGWHAPAIRRRRPFDLVLANILARPLVRLAPGMPRHLAPGGVAILSGLLAAQEPAVLAAYRAQGLRLRRRIAVGEWRALVLSRPRRRGAAAPSLVSRTGQP